MQFNFPCPFHVAIDSQLCLNPEPYTLNPKTINVRFQTPIPPIYRYVSLFVTFYTKP